MSALLHSAYIPHSYVVPRWRILSPSFSEWKGEQLPNMEPSFPQKEKLKRQCFELFYLKHHTSQSYYNFTKMKIYRGSTTEYIPSPISSARITWVRFDHVNRKKLSPSSWYGCNEPSTTDDKICHNIYNTKQDDQFSLK